MNRVSYSDEFFIKVWNQQKRKRSVLFQLLGLYTNEFCFLFRVHEAIWQTQYQSYRQLKDDKMEMKSKSYLRIIFLINYMMEESLLAYIEWSRASRFSVRKNVTKKRKKESGTQMDWCLRSRSCQFSIQKFHLLQYADSTYRYKISECH